MNKMGIADHFVTERLPKLLSQFARTYPLVKLEVEVNSGIALMESLDAYRLNLVIASREDAKQRPGQLLFREALVWVASKDFELSGTASIPLVLLPAPCQFRREALVPFTRRRIPAYGSRPSMLPMLWSRAEPRDSAKPQWHDHC
jgi:DNA-binding transcriptional LysR family regulator